MPSDLAVGKDHPTVLQRHALQPLRNLLDRHNHHIALSEHQLLLWLVFVWSQITNRTGAPQAHSHTRPKRSTTQSRQLAGHASHQAVPSNLWGCTGSPQMSHVAASRGR